MGSHPTTRHSPRPHTNIRKVRQHLAGSRNGQRHKEEVVGLHGRLIDNTYIFLANCALLAVVSITNAWTSTYHASSLVGTIVALVADTNQRARAHVRIANNAFTIAFFAEPSNSCRPTTNQTPTKHERSFYCSANSQNVVKWPTNQFRAACDTGLDQDGASPSAIHLTRVCVRSCVCV